MSKQTAELLFPNITMTPSDYRAIYPKRDTTGAVTRFAPSPTGFMHIGGLFAALINQRIAYQSNGIFYLRIEDTDKKREIEGGISEIVDSLSNFGIFFDEGMASDTEEKGAYGPYRQSSRADIYAAFAKSLLEADKAYPCFCTEEELEEIRKQQEEQKENPGYYGKWAVHREMPYEQVQKLIAEGKPYVLRLKSPGTAGKKVQCKDLIKGKIEMPENEQDIVLLKSDGIPTYHFAHVVDDYLMGTTHIIRGDEWLSSLPIHLQLFAMLGWNTPHYAHISPIMKLEGSSKRKLSKRKDPEAAVSYYHQMGYPISAVTEYLLNLANSGYEDWRRQNPDKTNLEYQLQIKNMSVSGALFDIAKLSDISKDVISRMNAKEAYDYILIWAQAYDPDFAKLLAGDEDFAIKILSIGRGGKKPRKDIAKWSDAKEYMAYFYDSLFDKMEMPEHLIKQEIIDQYLTVFHIKDDKETWFNKIREMAVMLGYAGDVKSYKENPSQYKGHVGDVSTVIRAAITKRENTPDLYEIIQLLGAKRVVERLGYWA